MPRLKSSSRNGSSQSPKAPTGVFLIRFVTKRSVCLSLIFSFCCASILFSLAQFPYNAILAGSSKPALGQIARVSPMRNFPIRFERDVLWLNDRDPSFSHLNTSEIKRQSQLMLKTRRRSGDESGLADPRPVDSALASNSSFQALVDSADSKRREDDYREPMGSYLDPAFLEVDPAREKLIGNVERYLLHKNHHSYYHQRVEELPEQTKGVIILTNYRSGSTFLGQLFNQHSKAFYSFEPLYPFVGDCVYQRQLKAKILQRMLKCDFPKMVDYYRQIKGPMRKNHVDILCLIDNFCFRKQTKELCQGDMCPFVNQKSKYCKNCGPLHLPKAMNLCRKKKLSVVKVIRLCNIMDLKSVITEPNMDIKIIHLVRDPRGIQSSRYKIHSNSWSMESNAELTCDRLLHNGQSGLANRSDTEWLKGRYMRVRYEDLSLKPLVMAEKILNFAGLELNKDLHTWITHNTRAKPRGSRVNPYETKRDSSVTMQAWRTHLNLNQVLQVQRVCARTMDFFGYKAVSTQKELDDLDVRLLS